MLIYVKSLNDHSSLRTSEANYLHESFGFYSAIRSRAYYSQASKEEK